ncbi:MAG: hypothetical protein MUD16_06620 [Desulfobacterales bacterium]|jgi:hypothetical protein|nr:hypothetical protein [Desulfobacterales bacterium]
MKPTAFIFYWALTAALLGPAPLPAAEEARLPAATAAAIDHLLSLVGPGSQKEFQPERVGALLKFIDGPKQPGVVYTAEPIEGAASAYTEVDVRMGLAAFLQYTFNPAVPWFVTTPSSLRWALWKTADPSWEQLPKLWEMLEAAERPVVIRGLETVENTPDLFSGAYYRYDLYRTLILMRHAGRNILISLSKQKDRSEVGKKGYIIGPDEDWAYFYSGEPGLTIGGLGWMSSYMYDSVGISVYAETQPSGGVVRTANIKWVRGGWSNLNVIQNEHIHKGMQRFAFALKAVLESSRLPSVQMLEDVAAQVARLSDAGIRAKMRVYRDILLARAERLSGGARKHLPESFWDEGLWQRMRREEMEAALVLESLKAHLGKSPPEEVRELVLFPTPQRIKQSG